MKLYGRPGLVTWITVLLCLASTSALAEYVSSLAGNTGGEHPYDLSCGDNGVLVGFSGRWDGWMDSIGIICRRINPDGTLGTSFTRGPKGGDGGKNSGNPTCEPGNVIQASGVRTADIGNYVHSVNFRCALWSPSTRTVARAPDFSTDTITPDTGSIGPIHASYSHSSLTCPPDGRPAVGIRGRYGWYVDSIQLVCDTPEPTTPSLIGFQEAPADGSAATLSISQGGAIRIRASGPAAPLTMTLSVMNSQYKGYFELATPPTVPPLVPPNTVGPLKSPPGVPSPTAPSASAQLSSVQGAASITRILKLKPLVVYPAGATPPMIQVSVVVKDANGATGLRSFVIRLQP